MSDDRSRRNVLRTLGVATVGGLAGCTSALSTDDSGSSTSEPTANGTPTSTPVQNQTATPAASEPAGESQLISDFENPDDWKIANGRVTSVRDSFAGSKSMKVVRGSGEPSLKMPVDLDLSGTNPSMAVKTTASSGTVVQVHVKAPNDKNKLVFREGLRALEDRGWIRIDPGAANVVGLPDLTSVGEIEIRLQGGSSGTAFWLDDMHAVPSPSEPTVALMFDDSRTSQYKAFEVLRDYDMPGSVGVITEQVGTQGSLSMRQLEEMKSAGWNMMSHTATQESLMNISRLTARNEIVAAKDWLVDHGFEEGSQFLAYPFGNFDASVLNFIDNHHEMAFRYLGTQSAGSGRITQPLTASRGNGARLDRARRMVDMSVLYNDLEILTFHGIGTDETLGMSLSDFEDLVAYIDKSDARVVTASTINEELRYDLDSS